MGTVLTQIFLRLGRAREDGLLPDSAFGYFLQQHHDHLYPGKAFLKIDYNHVDATRDGFEGGWGEDTIGRFLSEEETEEVEGISQPATETSLLLRPTALPHGWNVVENGGVGDASSTCYEDGFTHSVTLTKPKVSRLQMCQLTVVVLQQHGVDDLSCHVDLLACMRAGPGQKELGEFAHDLEKRFPYYDDAWFAAEWNTEPNMVNVLQTLKEPWRIQTFTSLLYTPGGGGLEGCCDVRGLLRLFGNVLSRLCYRGGVSYEFPRYLVHVSLHITGFIDGCEPPLYRSSCGSETLERCF